MSKTNALFAPITIGGFSVPNRFVMAPLTRGRANADRTPNELMRDYYLQRATAGLIVTEATAVSAEGYGWLGAPAIYNEAQAQGWRMVTDAVHGAGGRIFLQLWHMGRVSHPDFLNGALPVAPSALAASGDIHTPRGKKLYVTPRELTVREIRSTVNDYARGAKFAREAGFDGVEIHGANGYLVDQFLRDGSNKRNDVYGGSIPNRVRFLLEVTEAVAGAWSADRVGVRLSPVGTFNDMRDSDPVGTFSHAASELSRFGLAYLHVFEALPGHWAYVPGDRVARHLRKVFRGPLALNGGYDAEKGAAAINNGEADLVAFGTPFLANPDFVERARLRAPLNTPDMATFYSGGPKGYVDYPTLQAVSA